MKLDVTGRGRAVEISANFDVGRNADSGSRRQDLWEGWGSSGWFRWVDCDEIDLETVSVLQVGGVGLSPLLAPGSAGKHQGPAVLVGFGDRPAS